MKRRRLVEPTAAPPEPKSRAKATTPRRPKSPAAIAPPEEPKASPAPRSGSRSKGAASSSSPLAARIALETLEGQGSAVDAVIAAFFAEAGADASVLFSPVSALVFGGGAGVRAFDGRTKQPGLGGARPRGTRDGEAVLDAARVAVPRAPATMFLLHTMLGRASLSSLTRPGEAQAKGVGAALRAELIARFGASGGSANARTDFLRALVTAGGVAAGGALTETDLADALPTDVAISPSAVLGDARVYRVPWGSQVPAAVKGVPSTTMTDVVVACDSRGLVALLSFERGEGLLVPELEVELTLNGVAVRRGIPRTTPGTVLSAAAPLVLVDRGADLRVAFAANVAPRARVKVLTPKDVEPIALSTPVDVGVRQVARAIGATVAVVALEARGARTIGASDAAA